MRHVRHDGWFQPFKLSLKQLTSIRVAALLNVAEDVKLLESFELSLQTAPLRIGLGSARLLGFFEAADHCQTNALRGVEADLDDPVTRRAAADG